MKKTIGILITVTLVAGGLAAGYLLYEDNNNERLASTTSDTEASSSDNTPPSILDSAPITGDSTPPTTESLLLYLIEEEKLAHDVYTAMYDLYGTQVFGNILRSESTHQSRVLALLDSRGIADPRSAEPGVFSNQELQALYDQLILQGKISETEAFRVGVIIEEKDIKDISTQLETASDVDVIATLEDLRRGSENHLRAFSKQL
jgi:hypothetical protein